MPAQPSIGEIRELVRRFGDSGDPALGERLQTLGILRVRARNPSGEYAEYLASRKLGGELMPLNQPGYDLLLPDGTRIQVRARHVKTRAPKHYKVAANLLEPTYDKLLLVFFNPGYTIRWPT